jgi:hypothetical protein
VDVQPSQYHNIMLCIAFYESSYEPTVRNPSGATGLFQIMPSHCGEKGCPSGGGCIAVRSLFDCAVLLSLFEGAVCRACDVANALQELEKAGPNAQCAVHVLDTQGKRLLFENCLREAHTSSRLVVLFDCAGLNGSVHCVLGFVCDRG